MIGLEYFTNLANREASFDLVHGLSSKHWSGLTEQQALLIDITVTWINGAQPIVGHYDGFMEKRKSKAWFKTHQDEVFTSFFCGIVDALQAWHHFDDAFDKKFAARFESIYADFFKRNWQLSNEETEYRTFFFKVGRKWYASLTEVGIKIKEPELGYGDLIFISHLHGFLGYFEAIGMNGSELQFANVRRYFSQ